MNKDQINIDDLKKTNPFLVPDGYMEGLTSKIMGSLPEKLPVPPHKITRFDKVKPWLYMAAAFAGLVLLFKVMQATMTSGDKSEKDPLIVNVDDSNKVSLNQTADEEYLDYLESQYADNIMTDEMIDGE